MSDELVSVDFTSFQVNVLFPIRNVVDMKISGNTKVQTEVSTVGVT